MSLFPWVLEQICNRMNVPNPKLKQLSKFGLWYKHASLNVGD